MITGTDDPFAAQPPWPTRNPRTASARWPGGAVQLSPTGDRVPWADPWADQRWSGATAQV